MKKFFYSLFNNRVVDFLGQPFLNIFLPALAGIYYLILDVWGEDWKIIISYQAIHEAIFLLLTAFTIIVLFIKGVAEQLKGNVNGKYQLILESLILFFNDLVKKKKDRFFKSAEALTARGDVFKSITKPDDQIEFVLDGTKRLLGSSFGLDEKNIGITIIQGDTKQKKWWYQFKCDSQRQHTKAKDLMDGPSTARYCFDSGDSIFIPDIRKGIKEGMFMQSTRSGKSELGSIYCKPVRILVGGFEFNFIFTICVYTQTICIPYDVDECRACENLFDEVASRVELELYLFSIKQFKECGGVVT